MIKPFPLKLIIIFSLLSLFSSEASSEPQIHGISGQAVHNSIMNLSGSFFGEKHKPDPIRFDNWEGCQTGLSIAQATNWWVDVPTQEIVISTDFQRHNFTTKNAKAVVSAQKARQAYKNQIGFSETSKIFVNLWYRISWPKDKVYAEDENKAYQLKNFQIGLSIEPNGDNSWYHFGFHSWSRDNHEYTQHYIQGYYLHENGGSIVWRFPNSVMKQSSWYNIEFICDQGHVNTGDGKISLSLSSYNFMNPYYFIPDDFPFSANIIRHNSEYFDSMKLYAYLGRLSSGSCDVYWDDVYIDNSWARIVIGDKPQYHDCTHREIQLPTTWSDTNISFRVNLGSFTSNDSLFLFVIDDNNTISKGFPIIHDFKQIAPPQNPRVIYSTKTS
jgi:hypothetical protein